MANSNKYTSNDLTMSIFFYSQVTSKPDLYPLVFSYAGDTGKTGSGGGANYLMVQYFRNYIVRPVGSLSGTSTVDSLSSSFICTANEANTLVPPPYSRAASPDLSSSVRNYGGMPRSASQQACTLDGINGAHRPNSVPNSNYYGVSGGFSGNHGLALRTSESAQFNNTLGGGAEGRSGGGSATGVSEQSHSSAQITGSQSDHYRFSVHNGSNNNTSVASEPSNRIGSIYASHNTALSMQSNHNTSVEGSLHNTQSVASEHNNSNNSNNNNNNNNNANQSTTQRSGTANANIYSSCGSIGGISITIPTNSESDYQDLNALRRSLETCCQILHHQQQKQAQFYAHHQPSSGFTANSEDSPINVELAKKFEGLRNSYIGSNTGSNVSSLANLGTPDSPPRATSPTVEVRELLEQIRQLQNISATNSNSEGIIIINPQVAAAEASINESTNSINGLNHSNSAGSSAATAPPAPSHIRRPSSLITKKFFSKVPSQGSSLGGNKAMYIPISSNQNYNGPVGRSLRSPSSVASAAAAGLLSRGRSRCSWISKSAPTTPGTALPPGSGGLTGIIGDNSPLLLNEQDEDGEQNV